MAHNFLIDLEKCKVKWVSKTVAHAIFVSNLNRFWFWFLWLSFANDQFVVVGHFY